MAPLYLRLAVLEEVQSLLLVNLTRFYCETHKTVKTGNIYGMLLCYEK